MRASAHVSFILLSADVPAILATVCRPIAFFLGGASSPTSTAAAAPPSLPTAVGAREFRAGQRPRPCSWLIRRPFMSVLSTRVLHVILHLRRVLGTSPWTQQSFAGIRSPVDLNIPSLPVLISRRPCSSLTPAHRSTSSPSSNDGVRRWVLVLW